MNSASQTLKDGQEKTLDFELRRNVDSVIVYIQYLNVSISEKNTS